jgi:hypothetical protein
MKTTVWFGAVVVALGVVGGAGCQAYANAANGVLNSGVMKVTDGSVKVTNALSIPICKVSVFHDKAPDRSENDLHAANGKSELPPGGEGTVDIPHPGRAEEPTPEGMTYGLRVYACHDRTAYEKEPGSLVATIQKIDPKSSAPIVLH